MRRTGGARGADMRCVHSHVLAIFLTATAILLFTALVLACFPRKSSV
jgi:hypothetical protein